MGKKTETAGEVVSSGSIAAGVFNILSNGNPYISGLAVRFGIVVYYLKLKLRD